jgi:hypothetical protein
LLLKFSHFHPVSITRGYPEPALYCNIRKGTAEIKGYQAIRADSHVAANNATTSNTAEMLDSVFANHSQLRAAGAAAQPWAFKDAGHSRQGETRVSSLFLNAFCLSLYLCVLFVGLL